MANFKEIKNQAKNDYKFDVGRNAGVEAISTLVKFAVTFVLITLYIISLTSLGSLTVSVPATLLFLAALAAIYLFVIAPINLGRNLYYCKVADNVQPATDEIFHFFCNIKHAVYAYFRIALSTIFYTVLFTAVTIVCFRIYSLFSSNYFSPVNILLCAFIVVIYAICIITTRLKYSLLPIVYHRNSPITAIVLVAKTLRLSRGKIFELFKFHLSFAGWYLLGVISLGIGFIWIMPYIRIASNLYLKEIV